VNRENTFRECMLRIINDSRLRSMLSEGGIEYSKTLSGEVINRRYEDIYRKLCDDSEK
jgi:glycosyltransferase involved in cell wall biosynthesis